MSYLFIIGIALVITVFFWTGIEYFEDEWNYMQLINITALILGIVLIFISARQFFAETRQPALDKSYKQGQVDALNGIQHYDATYVYHDSILVDTLYNL